MFSVLETSQFIERPSEKEGVDREMRCRGP